MSRNDERMSANTPNFNPSEEPSHFNEGLGNNATPNIMTGGLNFPAPTYFVELPSGGKWYPPDHPVAGKTSLEIKYMTAKEEDILTSRALLEKGIALDRVLENLLVDSAIEVGDLLAADRNALVVGARITGFGETYSPEVSCPQCASRQTFDLDLEEGNTAVDPTVYAHEHGVVYDERGTFTVQLPLTQVEVVCKMMLASDENKISQEANRKLKNNMEPTPTLDLLRNIIVSINGIEDPLQMLPFLSSLPSRDSRFLKNTYEKVTPYFSITGDFSCSSCGHQVELEAPLTAEFFWPRQ
jgi:hypothetical protein